MPAQNPTDLQPAARPFSTFANPRSLVIPDAQTDNSLSQLGSALSRFNPTLNALAVQHVELENAEQVAAARQAFENTRLDYADAVQKGLIPPGASAAYISGYKAKELNNKYHQFAPKLQAAYEESGLQDSDEPNAMKSFLDGQITTYREAALMKDGQQLYTPLEMANSEFDSGIQSHVNNLFVSHTKHRATERTKQGMEINKTNAQFVIEQSFVPDDPSTYAVAAEGIVKSFLGPTGVGSNGLTKTEINALMVDVLTETALSSGDARVLDIAASIPTYQNNKLGDHASAREKFTTTRHTIANLNAAELAQDIRYSEAESLGLLTKDGRREHYNKIAQRNEEQYQHQQEAYREKGEKRTQEQRAGDESTVIQQLLADNVSIHNPYFKQHLDKLRRIDPDKAITLTNFATQVETGQTKKHEDEVSARTFTKLRADLYNNPSAFDASRIYAAGTSRHITEGQVNTLYNEAQEAKKIVNDDPTYSSPLISGLRSDLKAAVGGSLDNYGGLGAVQGNAALADFNQLFFEMKKSNPKMTTMELYDKLQPRVKELAGKYNSTVKDEIKKERAAREQAIEIDQMQERAAKEIESLRGQQTNYGTREDGTPKGAGYFGEVKRQDGKGLSTELSIGVTLNGKETLIPSMVPTLTPEEVHSIVNDGPITDAIAQKAIAHAKKRLAEGKSVWAQPGDAERSKLDAQLKAKYPNSKQRNEIIDGLLRKPKGKK